MRAYFECSPNHQKVIPYRPCHPAIDKTLKISEKFWLFLYLNFNSVLQFSSTSRLLHVYKQTTVSVIRELLAISVRCNVDFRACFCQPSRNVYENKMTSLQ